MSKDKKADSESPSADAAAPPSAASASATAAPAEPKLTLKAAKRKAIEQAQSIEELSTIMADLKPEELAQAQLPIYQARRRIVAAGIPKS